MNEEEVEESALKRVKVEPLVLQDFGVSASDIQMAEEGSYVSSSMESTTEDMTADFKTEVKAWEDSEMQGTLDEPQEEYYSAYVKEEKYTKHSALEEVVEIKNEPLDFLHEDRDSLPYSNLAKSNLLTSHCARKRSTRNDIVQLEDDDDLKETPLNAVYSSREPTPKALKRKLERNIILRRFMNKAENFLDSKEDEHDIFGKYLAKKMKKMSEAQRLLCEKQIIEVLFNGYRNTVTTDSSVTDVA